MEHLMYSHMQQYLLNSLEIHNHVSEIEMVVQRHS